MRCSASFTCSSEAASSSPSRANSRRRCRAAVVFVGCRLSALIATIATDGLPSQNRRRAACDKAIQQNRDLFKPRAHNGAGNSRDFTAAQMTEDLSPIGHCGFVSDNTLADHFDFVRECIALHAGAGPGPVICRAAKDRMAERRGRGRVSDPHLTDAKKVEPLTNRC